MNNTPQMKACHRLLSVREPSAVVGLDGKPNESTVVMVPCMGERCMAFEQLFAADGRVVGFDCRELQLTNQAARLGTALEAVAMLLKTKLDHDGVPMPTMEERPPTNS